jgi:hypothetical protein
MAVQSRLDIDNEAFVLAGYPKMLEDAVIAQDAGRATPLAPKTVMAADNATGEWSPLEVINPPATPATCTTGALGTDLAGFQAVVDGEFSIPVDGVDIELATLNFSVISTPIDTPAVLTCDTNGSLLAAWQAVTGVFVGDFAVTVNGVAMEFAGFDFAGIVALADIPAIINAQTVPAGLRCLYDVGTDVFSFVSTLTGQTATLTFLDEVAAGTAGTDISGSTGNLFLNGDAAPAGFVNGTGGIYGVTIADVINAAAAGRFTVLHDALADTMIFVSPTTGTGSAIGPLEPLAVPVGTPIEVAGFLNGEVGTAVLAAATGFESINIPAGIYIGDEILAATIVAGNVPNCPIMVAGPVTLNDSQIVLEGGLAMTDEITAMRKVIRIALADRGLVVKHTTLIHGYENP